MYEGDSFFTLTSAGQIGLLLLSITLAATVLIVAWWSTAHRATGWRLTIAAMLFYLFIWLSPQIYYLYYQLIIDGLPWQIVVKAPPGPVELVELLSFTSRPNLSAHSKGTLGWALLALALFRPRLALANT